MADMLITQIRKNALEYLADEAWKANLLRGRDDTRISVQTPSPAWYRDQIANFATPTPEDLTMSGDLHVKNQGPFYGEMNMFIYDAKYKKTLPYYDRFPLVIPILDRSFNYNPKKEFIGINFHYLPIQFRLKLINDLVNIYAKGTEIDLMGRESFTENTKVVITNFARLLSKVKATKPCVKHYLNSNIRSKIRRIKASEFVIASLLPVESFHQQNSEMSPTTVWNDSLKTIRTQ
jgi:hypothetical protein